jgi:hypothetical protein
MKKCHLLLWIVLVLAFAACSHKQSVKEDAVKESREAKELLQGIWLDAETEEVMFKAKGDTLFYTDSTSLPAYFRIVDDVLYIGSQSYKIVKQASHLFWFRNQNGDVVRYKKSDDPNDALSFNQEQPTTLNLVTEIMKRDSIVFYAGRRYHWYVAINPTKYKVTRTNYSDDGVVREQVYYDNIIHISIYKDAECLFSSDIKKQRYQTQIPSSFLSEAILGDMAFSHVDENGFHFNATICVPDGGTCYLVATIISFDGQLSMKLLEY